MMTPDGTIRRIAQSPDSDGLHGELNQPGEPIVWDGRIIASCFDLVTGPGKVNTGALHARHAGAAGAGEIAGEVRDESLSSCP